MERLPRYAFAIATALIVVSFVWAFLAYGQTVDMAQAFTRFTARVSLTIFVFVFTASALHCFFRSAFTAALLKNRRQLGLTFAYSHTVHLVAIITYLTMIHRTPSATAFIFGGLAYLLMYLMAFTSNDAAVRKLGAKNWKRLHKVGIFWLWFIFFATYLQRLTPSPASDTRPGGTRTEFVIGFIIILAILAIRSAAAVTAKANRRMPAPAENEPLS
jgi:DMSO/TMAO reductase YedYZ heme-binding membrane subunit